MSLRRPTVALLLFTFDISPLCDVAQTSDCGMLVIYFQYKPFMWCRSNVRLWHALSFIFYYKLFMWCRLDARLRHCYFFCFLSRSHSDTRLALSIIFGISRGLPPDFSLFFLCMIISLSECTCWSVHMHLVYICYILCPNCLASTFIVLTWLVDLARCWRGRSHGWRVW